MSSERTRVPRLLLIPLGLALLSAPIVFGPHVGEEAGTGRAPSSTSAREALAEKIQKIDLDIERLRIRAWSARQQAARQRARSDLVDAARTRQKDAEREINELTRRRLQLAKDLSAQLELSTWSGTNPWFDVRTGNLLSRVETFALENPTGFKGNRSLQPFALEHRLFKDYQLRLENRSELSLGIGERQEDIPLRARMECDAPMTYETGFLFMKREVRNKVYEFDWYNSKKNGQQILLRFDPAVSRCTLLFRERSVDQWTYRLNFRALDEIVPRWSELSNHLEVCPKPVGFKAKDPVSFFWSQDFSHVTCPHDFDKIVQLRPPLKALNAKIRGLTGSDVPKRIFDTKDPTLPLDFSKAPKFDVIWVSSLNFSADLYGSLIAQALRWHAERGTQIRILIPWATTMFKDKRMVEKMMAGLPSVKLQLYEFKATEGSDGTWIDEFHRVNHVKLLIGYSFSAKENNFLVTGGRNMRDSYLFHEKPNYSKFPWLTNYAAGEEPFIYYDDYELEMRGESLVRATLAQMLALWNRDDFTQSMRPTNLNIAKTASQEQVVRLAGVDKDRPVVRHVVSLPFSDDRKLETFYVEMINSAKKEILLTTPYFLPSERLSAAFSAAAERGVKIKVLTRLKLAGDGVPSIAEDVNKKGINRHLLEIEMYEWTDPKSILHAKLLVIDQKLSFISSVNMNHRSFLHDSEAGMLILSEKAAKGLREDVLGYFASAKQITSERKIGFFNGLLLDWAQNYF